MHVLDLSCLSYRPLAWPGGATAASERSGTPGCTGPTAQRHNTLCQMLSRWMCKANCVCQRSCFIDQGAGRQQTRRSRSATMRPGEVQRGGLYVRASLFLQVTRELVCPSQWRIRALRETNGRISIRFSGKGARSHVRVSGREVLFLLPGRSGSCPRPAPASPPCVNVT
jgi:hypothetical protein